MAIDTITLCAASVENESSQVLATVLSICFCLYTGVTILLACLQLYSVSNKPLLVGKAPGGALHMPPASGDMGLVSAKR